MRQTDVCLNRVYQVICKSYVKYVKFISRAQANSGAREKSVQ